MNKPQMQQAMHISRWLVSPRSNVQGAFFSTRFQRWVRPSREVSLAAAILATVQSETIEQARNRALLMVQARVELGMQFPSEFWKLAVRLVGKPNRLRGKAPGEILEQQELDDMMAWIEVEVEEEEAA